MYGLSVLPLMYLASWLFQTPCVGFGISSAGRAFLTPPSSYRAAARAVLRGRSNLRT